MRRPGWTFAIVSIALFMVVLDNLVVTTALPSIRADLGATIQSLEWTVNAYTLSYAVLLLTGAALGDRFGRRRMFLVGLAMFTVASAGAALAPTTAALIGARAIQGVGAAIVTPLTLTLLADVFPPERRGLAIGAWSGISGLGVALGPLIGGAIVDGISWHWIFWINVPIGLALLPLANRRLAESHGPARSLDLPGLGAGQRRPARHRLRHRPRRRAGLDEHARARLADRRRRADRRVPGLGGAGAGADAPAALLPLARLRGRQRRVAGDVLRRLRLDLPAGPVLPGHAGLLAARGRAADAAVDDHADVHRPDRRPAVGPDRLAAADGDGPGAAGRRDRLAGLDLHADGPLRRPGDPVHHGRHRHGAGLRSRPPTRCSTRSARGGRPGVRRDQRDPRAGRRARRRGARLGVRAQRLVRLARRLHRRHDERDLGRRRGARGRRARRAARPGPPPRRARRRR